MRRTEKSELMTIDEAFEKLNRSTFRSKFVLSDKDKKYFAEKGEDTIKRHTEDFIRTRLAPASIPNDGKQTPMRGHPTFVAQHACACCCRGCLNKWYKVPKGRELTESEIEKIVNFLMAWMKIQIEDGEKA